MPAVVIAFGFGAYRGDALQSRNFLLPFGPTQWDMLGPRPFSRLRGLFIPRHVGQQAGQAAEAGYARKQQPRADQTGQKGELRRDKAAEEKKEHHQ